jgi:hypothetical protein
MECTERGGLLALVINEAIGRGCLHHACGLRVRAWRVVRIDSAVLSRAEILGKPHGKDIESGRIDDFVVRNRVFRRNSRAIY